MKFLRTLLGLGFAALAMNSVAFADLQIRCESEDQRYTSCYVGERFNEVTLLNQLSEARCNAGSTFGIQNGYVWVDRGCRGIFRVSKSYNRNPDVKRCESDDYGYRTCYVGYFRDVELYRQLSNVRCNEGSTWGVYPREGYIWVDQGCRADFLVYRWR